VRCSDGGQRVVGGGIGRLVEPETAATQRDPARPSATSSGGSCRAGG